jgi:hypothetical protein
MGEIKAKLKWANLKDKRSAGPGPIRPVKSLKKKKKCYQKDQRCVKFTHLQRQAGQAGRGISGLSEASKGFSRGVSPGINGIFSTWHNVCFILSG